MDLMDKVAIRVSADPTFFGDVAREAARLDRSPSWLLGRCLDETLPKLASAIVASAPRPRVRAARDQTLTFFVPRYIALHCGRLAARLGISSDDVLAWAWLAGRDDLRALPSS